MALFAACHAMAQGVQRAQGVLLLPFDMCTIDLSIVIKSVACCKFIELLFFSRLNLAMHTQFSYSVQQNKF